MAYKNINDLIDTYAVQKGERYRLHDSALVVLPKRYTAGGNFVAFLSLGEAHEANIVAVNLAEDTGYEQFMQDCDWFPYGVGETLDDALAMLDARCAKVPHSATGFTHWLNQCRPIWRFFSDPHFNAALLEGKTIPKTEPR